MNDKSDKKLKVIYLNDYKKIDYTSENPESWHIKEGKRKILKKSKSDKK